MHPGDIVMGDQNGVVIVPREIAADLLERLRERTAAEADYTAAVARGEFSNRWVDTMLGQSGLTPDA